MMMILSSLNSNKIQSWILQLLCELQQQLAIRLRV